MCSAWKAFFSTLGISDGEVATSTNEELVENNICSKIISWNDVIFRNGLLSKLKATFSFHKITTKKHSNACLPYILISHFTWLLQWFIILDMNNSVKVSHHYYMLLKLSIKLKSTWAAKWGTPFSNLGGTMAYS